MNLHKLLKSLTETPGPSGFEDEIATVIGELWEPYTNELTRDNLGNILAVKHGSSPAPRRRILLASHMDEIGLMVARIEAHNGQGFLRVTNLGGVDIRHLYGQRVIIHGRKNLPGIIGSLPGFMLPAERQDKPYGWDDLLVDPGLPLDEVEKQISIGDSITFRQNLHKLQNKRVTGKALDNRASVVAVTACLDYLQSRQHRWDVLAVATVQEETRLLGAYTTAFAQQPDLAIAIDVTFGKGPGATDYRTHELDSGPVLDIGPNVHPGMYKALKETADTLEMKVCNGTHTRGSGTDAYGLQVARTGVPTAVLSIPLRYMHTMVETIAIKDVERVGRLLAEFIVRLDDNFLPNLTAALMDDHTEDED
jgi:endoglucanase